MPPSRNALLLRANVPVLVVPVLVVVVLVVVVDVVLVDVVSADAALPPPHDANTRLVASSNALQIEVFMGSLLSVGG